MPKRFVVPRSWSLRKRLLFRSRKLKNGCRIWVGGFYPDGYGKMSWEGKYQRVHRLAWRAWKGPIPKGKLVCHHCDTPACIAHGHLFIGTHADNVADKMRKGRESRKGSKGITHPNTDLTEEQVLIIFHSPDRQIDLAKRFGVQQAAISKIKRKKTWGHLHA